MASWINSLGRVRPKEHHRAGADTVAFADDRYGFLPLDNVFGRIERSIDPAAPRIFAFVVERREFEIECLPVSVEDEVDEPVWAA
jgi:hypothetical protein